MSKNFIVSLEVRVVNADQEAEECLDESPLDFIETHDLLDEARITVREI